MPRKPRIAPRPCQYPRCPNLTMVGQYCDVHRAEATRRYDKLERSPDHNRRYGHDWRQIRNRYISMHPLCEVCLLSGKLNPADEVHHIVSLDNGGTHDDDNLQSLCKSCHTKTRHT